jgi:hypothetical protein
MTERRSQVVDTPASFSGVPSSDIGPETGYPEFFRGFPQSLQANPGIVRKN